MSTLELVLLAGIWAALVVYSATLPFLPDVIERRQRRRRAELVRHRATAQRIARRSVP